MKTIDKTIRCGNAADSLYMDVEVYEVQGMENHFALDIYVKRSRNQPQNWGWDFSNQGDSDLVTGSGSIRCLHAAAKIAAGWAHKHRLPLFIFPADSQRAGVYRRIEKYGASPFTEIQFNDGKVTFTQSAWVFN